MDRLTVLAPAALGVGYFVVNLIVYAALIAAGRAPDLGRFKAGEILGPFWAGYMVWLTRPIERALVGARIAPTTVTAVSLGLCVTAGVAVALGHLATGAWLFIAGGILDMLDGRLARATNRQTKAGALFDSVADRWAEIAMLTGFAWFLREHGAWFVAVMAATGGSLMVSYTRARGEALGLDLKGGAMQRAERVLLIAVGTLAAAWLSASIETRHLAAPTIGTTLLICGVLSTWTAIHRWVDAHRALVASEPVSAATTAFSTGHRNTTVEDLRRFHPIERLSRTRVEFPRDGVKPRATVLAEVGALREVLTEQPVGVLVAASLPRTVWVAEEHIDVRIDLEANVLGHLLALVPRHSPTELSGKPDQLTGYREPYVLRRPAAR
jgi:phosphatidylglycerophosphate synthase